MSVYPIHGSQEEFKAVLDMELGVMCTYFLSFKLDDRKASQSAQAEVSYLTKTFRLLDAQNKAESLVLFSIEIRMGNNRQPTHSQSSDW